MARGKILPLFCATACLLGFAPHKKIGSDFLPASGQVRLAVILAGFPDQPPTASPQEVERMLFSEGRVPAGSVAEYFSEVSGGKVKITGKVFGWLELSKPEAYYANSSFGHNPASFPKNAGGLVAELIELAAGAGADFSGFDNSGDGAVDGLVIIFSGKAGGAEGNKELIWPWVSYLTMDGVGPKVKNNVTIDRYAIVSELNARSQPNFVMPLCHELGHLFGLPDLYDWSNNSFGAGRFELMAAGVFGGGKPFWPSAWTRAYLGWAEAEELDAGGKYKLAPAEKDGPVFKINSAESREYFLIENRQPLGKDQGLFGKGMVIYHVDEKVLTANNQACTGLCPKSHYLLSVEQADGENHLERKSNAGDAGDFFPGITRASQFNDATGEGETLLLGASGRLWDGSLSGIRISGIRLKGEEVTFRLKLDKPKSPDPFSRELRLTGCKIVDLGDGDSVLEPGEEFRIIPVVSNQGPWAGGVKVTAAAPELEIPKAAQRIGMMKAGEVVEAVPGLQLRVLDSWQGARPVAITLKIKSGLVNFSREEKIEVVVGRPEIALVMDDDGLGLKSIYQAALKDAGKVFHTIEVKDKLPDLETLNQFKLIIWATGVRGADGNPALDQARQQLLSSVLDNGTNLLLISPGLDLDENSGLAEKLGIKSAHPNQGIGAIQPEAKPSQLIPLSQFYFPAANPCAAIDPASSKVIYKDSREHAIAVLFQRQDQSALTLTAPLEALKDKRRAELLKELLEQY